MDRPFDHCAADYARCRPGYPQAVLETVLRATGCPSGRVVVDVGSGTGILTGELAKHYARVIAVDPSAVMLRHIQPQPGVARVCGRAEQLPVMDRSADLVTVAQAFHWFNPPRALAEFARVIRPGGVMMLCWNNRDVARSEFTRAYEQLIKTFNPAYQREYRRQDWAAKIAASGLFMPAERHEFTHDWILSGDGFVGFCRSVSYIRNVLSRPRMKEFERRLRALIGEHFEDHPCIIPLSTELLIARRREVMAAGY